MLGAFLTFLIKYDLIVLKQLWGICGEMIYLYIPNFVKHGYR